MTGEFGEVVYSYSRAQALEDGVLVAATRELAHAAGWTVPVAYTAAVVEQAISVPPGLEDVQDRVGREWDVLYLAALAARRAPRGTTDPVLFGAHVRKDRREATPPLVRLKLVVGPGDHGEPVATIMLPDED